MKKLLKLYRYIFRHCMDCGIKLSCDFSRGDVCTKCFDNFNGVTLKELGF